MPYCFHCNDWPLPRSTGQPQTIMQMVGHGHGVLPYKWWGQIWSRLVACQPLLYSASPILAWYKSHLVRMQILIQNRWVGPQMQHFWQWWYCQDMAQQVRTPTALGHRRIMCCVPYNLILILFLFTEGKIRKIVLQLASFIAQLWTKYIIFMVHKDKNVTETPFKNSSLIMRR